MPQSIFGLPGSGNPDQIPIHTDSQLSQYNGVWIYDTPGTYLWTKPDGVEFVIFTFMGGGSGGGSGRKGANLTARGAGGGGGGSALGHFSVEATALPSALTIVVGAGGAGGAGRTGNDTDGAAGAAGGATQIYGSVHDNSNNTFKTSFLIASASGGDSGSNQGTTTTPTNSSLGSGQIQGGWTTNAAISGNLGGHGASISVANATTRPRSGVMGRLPIPMLNYLSPWGNSGGHGGDVGSAGAPGAPGCGGGGGGAGTNDVIDSGSGGKGGDGIVVIQTFGRNPKCDLKVFNESSVWEKPLDPSFTMAHIICIGAGGGGGSGRLGATSTYRGGGAGGAPGTLTAFYVPLSLLPNSMSVVIGKGGAGGAAQTTNDTNGNPGADGELTSIGNIAYGHPGLGGNGGSTGPVYARGGAVSYFEQMSSLSNWQTADLLNSLGGISESQNSGGDFRGVPGVGLGGGGIPSTNFSNFPNAKSRQFQYSGSPCEELPYANFERVVPWINPAFGGWYTAGVPGAASHNTGIDGRNGTRGCGGNGGAGNTNGLSSGAGGNGGNGQITVLCF